MEHHHRKAAAKQKPARSRAQRINFTRKALLALRPPARTEPGKPAPRSVYWDTQSKGLCVRVTESGTVTFSVHRRVKNTGTTSTVTIGRFPDISIEKARAEAERLGAEYALGADPARARRQVRRELTLDELYEEYIKRMVDDEEMRRPDKKDDLYRLYLAHWGKRKLRNIASTEVADWFRALPDRIVKRRAQERREREKTAKVEGRTIAPPEAPNTTIITGRATANQALKLLRTMYRKAIHQWELYEGHIPGEKIKFNTEAPRKRFINKGEMPAFLKAVMSEKSIDIRDYVIVSMLTGARRANVLAMEWSELQLDHGRGAWLIPREKSKTKEGLNVALTDEVVAFLRDRRDLFAMRASKPIEPPKSKSIRAREHYEATIRMRQNEAKYVFPSVGKTGHMVEPKRAWYEILKRAGLKELRIHDLRRTLGSWLAAQNTNLKIIQESLGHQSIDATLIYTQLDLDPVRDSVAKATDAMLNAASPKKQEAEVIPLKSARR